MEKIIEMIKPNVLLGALLGAIISSWISNLITTYQQRIIYKKCIQQYFLLIENLCFIDDDNQMMHTTCFNLDKCRKYFDICEQMLCKCNKQFFKNVIEFQLIFERAACASPRLGIECNCKYFPRGAVARFHRRQHDMYHWYKEILGLWNRKQKKIFHKKIKEIYDNERKNDV